MVSLYFDKSPWKNIYPDLSLYRYEELEQTRHSTHIPIVMLHGPMTSHRTWDALGKFLWQNGFNNLYAVDIADVQMGALPSNTLTYLDAVVQFILEDREPNSPIILIGHSTGGVLARRYLHRTEMRRRILYLFSLASPHYQTSFSHTVYVPPENDLTGETAPASKSSVVRTPNIPQGTFLVNIFGNVMGPGFDGIVRGVHLPEAVNIVMPLGHSQLKSDERVMREILACLRGERYRVQLFLQRLYMKMPEFQNVVGPFYFEIDGVRSPLDGIFQAEAEHEYTFDENNTPLGTVYYPLGQTLASVVFRLKDKSKSRQGKRRLFAKLLVSLGEDDESVVHEMPDNQGSQITLRVRTQRMPNVLT